MIKAFFISSHKVSDTFRASGIKHFQSLANRHGFFITSTKKHDAHLGFYDLFIFDESL
jgi:hypothetical protein